MPHQSTKAGQAIHDNGVLSLDDETASESARWLGFAKTPFLGPSCK
jgi:hypothetical protein